MYTYRALCTKIIDGDTAEFSVDLGFNIKHVIRGRLLNVDAPELFSGNKRDLAAQAAKKLHELIANKTMIINTHKDKMSFNRWIIEIKTVDGKSINEEMQQYCVMLELQAVAQNVLAVNNQQ